MNNPIDKLDALYKAGDGDVLLEVMDNIWPELRAFLEAYDDWSPHRSNFDLNESYIALMAAIERETKDD